MKDTEEIDKIKKQLDELKKVITEKDEEIDMLIAEQESSGESKWSREKQWNHKEKPGGNEVRKHENENFDEWKNKLW